MESSDQAKSSNGLSQPSDALRELTDQEKVGLANLEHCLKMYDEKGEAGLQEALDRIYPPAAPQPIPNFPGSPFKRVPMGPAFPNSWAIMVPSSETPPTRK